MVRLDARLAFEGVANKQKDETIGLQETEAESCFAAAGSRELLRGTECAITALCGG